MIDKFRVGVSASIRRSDGQLLIPEVDLTPLTSDARVEVTSLPDVGQSPLLAKDIADLDAVILMLEKVGEHSFTDNQKLLLVARYGVGFDTVDVEACTRHGVLLATTPEGVRRPVATTVIGFMLALTLRLPCKDRITRQSDSGWATKTDFNGMGLVGRTLGGVGVGNIGAEVFRLARPFDMKLIAHDPYVDPHLAEELNITLVSLDEVFRQSDVLTLNCPLNDETRHLVSADRLALMKPSSYLINTARGPVVDESALIEALQAGRIAGAGLDVFEQEPTAANNPLLAMENVILSPHALCFTDQCLAGIGAADVNACLAVLNGGLPDFMVNPAVTEQAGFIQRQSLLRKVFD